jgi:hypothetical protein
LTYALFEERVPAGKRIDRDEALARLTRRYFESHGPAQLKDFAWWSGLSTADAAKGLDMAAPNLLRDARDGKTYWFSSGTKAVPAAPPRVLLLSIYDEFTIAYRDRSDLSDQKAIEKMIARGNTVTAVLIIDGRLAGTWKRASKPGGVDIAVHPFRPLGKLESEALEQAAARFGRFLGLPVFLT